MTLSEFKEEFNFKYDAASQGGPDIDDYELSLMLTQAVRDITELAVSTYEANEDSKRLMAGLLKYHNGTITKIANASVKFMEYTVSLPENLLAILREEPKLNNCVEMPEVVVSRIDEVNTMLNNPFKKPNTRKVLKIEKSKFYITVFAAEELKSYKFTYVKDIDPIIISDLEDGLSIEGLSVKHETILPAYMHHKIIDVAVAKAMMAVRSSGLQKQQ